MKAKLKLLAVASLAVSPIVNAFVSYDEPSTAKPVSAAIQNMQKPATTQALPTAGQNPGQGAMCANGGSHFDFPEVDLVKKQLSGNGKLIAAARLLAPKGWQINDKSSSRLIVSWNVFDAWPVALEQAAKNAGSCAFINYSTKSITLVNDTAGSSAAQITPIAGVSGHPGAASVAATPVPTAIVSNSWVLLSGKTLRENLVDWGKKAGWKVVWKIKDTDFRITHDGALTGTFVEALTKLAEAYESGNTPISINIYEDNRVFEIVDHTPFKRNTVQ